MVMMYSQDDYLDIRVFCVSIACADRQTVVDSPAALALRYFLPATNNHSFAGAVSPSPLLVLRRDRTDFDTLEITYVSTHRLHAALPAPLRFAVYSGADVFLCGVVAHRQLACTKQQQQQQQQLLPLLQQQYTAASAAVWTIQCMAAPRRLLCNARTRNGKAFLEVSIAGKASSGLPVVLSETVFLTLPLLPLPTTAQLLLPLHGATAALATIVEDEHEGDNWAETTTRADTSGLPALPRFFGHLKDSVDDKAAASDYPCWRGSEYKYEYEYGSDEEQEGTAMSWFKAGVRVGVGLGMGMCIGLGVGVGILLHSYISSPSPSSILQQRRRRIL